MLEALQKPGVTRRPDQGTNFSALLIELLGNMRAEESRCSGQQNWHRRSSLFGRSSAPVESNHAADGLDDDSDHPDVLTYASKGFETSIEMFPLVGCHVAGSQQ